MTVSANRLVGDIEFAPKDVYPFADSIFQLIKAGYINAVSVGFLPLEYSWSDEEGREGGIDFSRQELLEISIVPVPCNANALQLAGLKGLDVKPLVEWAERAANTGKIAFPSSEMRRLKNMAKPRTAAERIARAAALKAAVDGRSTTDPDEALLRREISAELHRAAFARQVAAEQHERRLDVYSAAHRIMRFY